MIKYSSLKKSYSSLNFKQSCHYCCFNNMYKNFEMAHSHCPLKVMFYIEVNMETFLYPESMVPLVGKKNLQRPHQYLPQIVDTLCDPLL